MFDWLPDQKSLYIATSSRHKNWKEIVAFPQIKLNGNKALLSFVNDHKHVISGRIESITETAAEFLIDRTGEGGEPDNPRSYRSGFLRYLPAEKVK